MDNCKEYPNNSPRYPFRTPQLVFRTIAVPIPGMVMSVESEMVEKVVDAADSDIACQD